MRWVLAFAVAGCVPTGGPTHRLPEDAHYVGIVAPFDSVEACVRGADDPRSCSFALAFCEDGRAARRRGGTIEEGTYYVDEDVTLVHAFVGVEQVYFDVEAVAEVGSAMEWRVDDSDWWQHFLFETIDCRLSR